MKGIAGRLAVVTGAARGIGAAIAARLAEEGARLVLVDRDAEGVAAVASRLSAEAVAGGTADDAGRRADDDRPRPWAHRQHRVDGGARGYPNRAPATRG